MFAISESLRRKSYYEICFRAQNVVWILLMEDNLSIYILNIVIELNIFNFFEKDVIEHLCYFFERQKLHTRKVETTNNPNPIWSYFLRFFRYFPDTFINECVADCQKQKNLSPLILALRFREVNLNRKESNSKQYVQQFENFKKELIVCKLISLNFILKCTFKSFIYKNQKIKFNKYYSSFNLFNLKVWKNNISYAVKNIFL